ncbi:Lysozyme [uncultured Alphaproteobacteria bacterium]|uniref:Lysozyme n=1 Tax=uncultured Alphaproteobacteria bacterium TaxID=91750 RepID=A0A212KMZ8_9PROT|nr:Lysozyme [uncultured Alphaproteobacteria bacterium]
MARLPKSILSLVTAGATAVVIATAFVGEKEGLTLESFQDGAGVWTICNGITEGVKPGQTATEAECARLFASEIGKRLAAVDEMVTAPMSPARHAAITSLCYNIGLSACRRSTLIRKLNAGDPNACDEILRWHYSGGQDCTDPKSNCRGIPPRREQERELCLL